MIGKQTDYANMMNVNREPPKGDMHLWTMRDEYAKAALSGLLATNVNHSSDEYMFARDAFKLADAMMKAREVRND